MNDEARSKLILKGGETLQHESHRMKGPLH